MVDFLIVVNGLPGAGKTTLAGPLARSLGVPLIAKDAIKEALADAVGVVVSTTQLGGLALDNVWAIARMLKGTVIIESFWASGRDDAYFAAGYASIGAPPGIEIWCEAGDSNARSRFRTRERHPVHQDGGRLEQWEGWVGTTRPISKLPTMTVSTELPVDVNAVAAELRSYQSRVDL